MGILDHSVLVEEELVLVNGGHLKVDQELDDDGDDYGHE